VAEWLLQAKKALMLCLFHFKAKKKWSQNGHTKKGQPTFRSANPLILLVGDAGSNPRPLVPEKFTKCG
jgi:hypothetical protein